MKRAYREDDWKAATGRRAKRGAGELRVTALYVLHYADAVSPSNRWVERTEGWRSAMQLRNGSTTARQRIHHQKYWEQDFIRCWIYGTRVTDIVLIRGYRLRLLNTDNCCTCKCRYTNTLTTLASRVLFLHGLCSRKERIGKATDSLLNDATGKGVA
jgi:hypothetical protein